MSPPARTGLAEPAGSPPSPGPVPHPDGGPPAPRTPSLVADTALPGGPRVRVLRPAAGLPRLDLGAVWAHRELVVFLVRRDLALRYRQTALGVTWALLQPLATMLVFSVFFGRFARMPSDGVPYPLFALCALIPWQLFAHTLSEATHSVVANQALVTKVYFPRLVIPLSAVLAGFVDAAIAFVALLAMMAVYGYLPGGTATPSPSSSLAPAALAWTIRLLPLLPLATLGFLVALGVGLWLSALNVRYRDVRYALPFLTQLWFFATPIAYPSSLVPERLRFLLGLNPMSGVVEGCRWALLGTPFPSPALLASSVGCAAVFLVSGLFYFRRMERSFADLV